MTAQSAQEPKGAGKGQGAVQSAFQAQKEWAPVFDEWTKHDTVQEEYGDVLAGLSEEAKKVLAARSLVPLAKAKYAANAKGLLMKRKGILNGYRDFAEKKEIAWRKHAAELQARGDEVWEQERLSCRAQIGWPDYYLRHGYDGALHSYDRGNGEWQAAFDAPSAYMLVHLHHYPTMTPQAAFDALHAELDNHALKHLEVEGRLQCLDVGCGVGTSTFSTARSLEQAGRAADLTGLDLSDYFIAVGRFLAQEAKSAIVFKHGNGLNLAESGFAEASLDLITVSEVTHELPVTESRRLMKEVARVLKPGGVLAYLDLNQVQILKDNPVGALVDRVATSNEPYFDEYLTLNAAEEMRQQGLEVVEETWPNKDKYPTMESCSLRIIIAKKPVVPKAPAVPAGGYPAKSEVKVDFQGKPSSYEVVKGGVRGLLAYDVCEPLTKQQYDEWLFAVHYPDLLANPNLEKIVLNTVSETHVPTLSSGQTVDGERFYRLAELHFASFDAFHAYVAWFKANPIPAPRTPAGKSAFKFYLLSEAEEIRRC